MTEIWPIEKRCGRRDTRAFVVADTVDALGEKMIGIIADRRMTKMHRYLGESNKPRLFSGLRLWPGGYSGPTTQRSRQSVSVSLASNSRQFEGIGFSIGLDNETEEQAAKRYHNPEEQWLGQRRDITLVELDGWPGSRGRDDSIRIEHWNQHGVGQQTIVVFDDVDPIQELAWDVKGDKERQVCWDDEFCTFHTRHIEAAEHEYRSGVCALRQATLAENLRVLADLAAVRDET